MVNNAYDKYKNLSIQTREAINQNISKKNIFQINIDPRCIIIPLNKYDFSNSKVLIFEFGNIKMDNSLNSKEKIFDEKYPKKYYFSLDSLSIDFYKSMKEMKKHINKIEVLKDVSGKIGISILNKKLYSIKENPPMKLQISIDNITLQLTEYIYTILIQLSNILKPVNEKDLWNQLITDKKDIAKNAKVTALVLKKNYFGSNYENFLAMISGGYIYFYNSGQDEEYTGYYYLKDAILNPNKDNLSIELENYSGTIEIKFRNETKFKSWEKCLRERIEEMTTSNIGRDEIFDSKINKLNNNLIDKEKFTFGTECIFKSVNLVLIHETHDNKLENMFKISINSLLLGLLMRSEDIELNLSIDGVKIFDLQEKINEFQQIISSEDENDKETKLLNLNILLPSEKSPKYKGNQIEVILNFGYLYVIWNPISFSKLLFFLIYNDDLTKKVISEISDPNEQLIEQKFIEPSKEKKQLLPKCDEYKYVYLKFHAEMKRFDIICIQPILKIFFIQLRCGESYFNCDMNVDHLIMNGELGNTEIFDLSEYPFTIKNQNEFKKENIRQIFGIKNSVNKSLIDFEFKSFKEWCPHFKDNISSIANVKINSIFFIYIQEQFLRLLNYFIFEFLGVLSKPIIKQNKKNEEKKEDENNINKAQKDEREMSFFKLNISMNNPQIILKPRIYFKESLILDLGIMNLTNNYSKVNGKLFNKKDEWRWLSSYQVKLQNFSMEKDDKFKIFEKSNGIINMHFTLKTESDMQLNDFEFDSSFQFDLFFDHFNLTLRQSDYTFLMSCLDLNILYTDDKNDDYDYEKLYKVNSLIKSESIISEDETKKLKEKLLSMFYVIFIQEISVILCFKNHDKFCSLKMEDNLIIFSQKLDTSKIIDCAFGNIEVYELKYEKDIFIKDLLVSDYSQKIEEYSEDPKEKDDKKIIEEHFDYEKEKKKLRFVTNENQSENINLSSFGESIKNSCINYELLTDNLMKQMEKKKMKVYMTINTNRDKFYLVDIEKLKLLMKADTFYLMETFFLEGFPFYDPSSKDLPNLFDSNEENSPAMDIKMNIKHPLICILGDECTNLNQEMYCIDSEVTFILKQETIIKVKNDMINSKLNKNDKSKIVWIMQMEINNISPFICSLKDILNSEILQISKRKLTNDFNLIFTMKTNLNYESDLVFKKEEITQIKFSSIETNMSFRDIIVFMNMTSYSRSLLSENFYEKLNEFTYFSNKKKLWEENNKNNLQSQNKNKDTQNNESKSKTIEANEYNYLFSMESLDLFLIDNQLNTFIPFLNFKSRNFKINYIYPKQGEHKAIIAFSFMIYGYNYIAGVWEPIIEKNKGFIDYKYFSSNIVKTSSIEVNISEQCLNINICDLHISFLYNIFKRWNKSLYNKYNKEISNNNLNNNFKNENNNEKKMKISNHTLFNYTGKLIEVFDHDIDYKKINRIEVPNNKYYEINYPEIESKDNQNTNLIGKKNLGTSYNKNKTIEFYFKDGRIGDNEIKIDILKQRKHQVIMNSNIQLESNILSYSFIVSKVELLNKKKAIYLFSPLCFRNKTKYNIKVIITDKDKKYIQDLKSKEIIGVSFEYFNGYIEFNINNSSIHRKIKILQFFTSKEINKTLEYDEFYVYLYSPKGETTYNKIIEIRNRYVLRNCLPFDVYFYVKGKQNNKRIALLKSNKYECDMIDPNSNFEIILTFLNFSTDNYITLYNINDSKQITKIILNEDKIPKIDILCTIIGDRRKKITAILHPNSVLIIHSSLSCNFYYGKDNKGKNLVAGKLTNGNMYLLKSEQKYLNMECVAYGTNFIGKPFNIEVIGTTNSFELISKKANKKIEFLVDNNLFLLSTDLNLYCNIISIYPKYVLSNSLNEKIIIRNLKNSEIIQLNSKNNNDFYFFGYGEESPIQIAICDKDLEWENSPSIVLNNLKAQTIIINNVQKTKKRYINISKKIKDVITYINIENTTFENARITIENFSSLISINAYQNGFSNFPNYIDCLNKTIFVWPNINEKHILNLQFGLGNLKNRPIMINNLNSYELLEEGIDLYSQKEIYSVPYPHDEVITVFENENVGHFLRLIIINNGISIKIKIYDKIDKKRNSNIENNEYKIIIKQMGFSLISDNTFTDCKKNYAKYDRKELLFFSFKELKLEYIQNKENSNLVNNLSFEIKNVEIDNQISNIDKFLIFLKQKDMNSQFIQFNIEAEENLKNKIFKINYISFNLQDFILKAESSLLKSFFKFTNNITLGLKTSITNVHPIFLSFMDSFKENIIIKFNYIQPIWQKYLNEDSTEEKPIFINKLEISSINLHLTLLNQQKDNFYESLLSTNPVLNKLSQLYDNIDTSISIEENKLMNLYGISSTIISTIITSYKQKLILQLIRVGINMELLGQPVNFINSIGTGVKEFINQPKQGFEHGEVVQGVIKGGIGLIKNTAGGTFNSVSQMSSGISSTLLNITNDKEYLNKRQIKKITEKPNNFMEGLGYGLTSMAGGIFYGVTDIVRKPIEGIKEKKNIAGFGKGFLKGIGGVITKPIAGVIDLVSKTSEGFKNTFNEDVGFVRERLPMPLYGKFKFYKEYIQKEAILYYFIMNVFMGKNIKILNFISYYNSDDKNIILVFSEDKVYLLDYAGKESLVNIDLVDIAKVQINNKFKVKIYFKRNIKDRKSSTIKLSTNPKYHSEETVVKICNMFKEILDIE